MPHVSLLLIGYHFACCSRVAHYAGLFCNNCLSCRRNVPGAAAVWAELFRNGIRLGTLPLPLRIGHSVSVAFFNARCSLG